MILSEHSLRQLDETYIRSLPEKACQDLAIKLWADLKTVREHQNQNSGNSSMPPSSRLPWAIDRSADDGRDELPETKGADNSGPEHESTASTEQRVSGGKEDGAKDKSLKWTPKQGQILGEFKLQPLLSFLIYQSY